MLLNPYRFVSTPPPITCSFPLSNSGLSGFGYAAPTSISGDGQTISQTLASGNSQVGVASLTQTVPADSGTVVCRIGLVSLPLMAPDGSEGYVFARIAFYDIGFGQVCVVNIIANNTGSYDYVVSGSGAAVSFGPLTSLPPFVDVAFRSVDGEFDVFLPDGSPLAQDVTYTPQDVLPLLSITGNTIAAGGIGKVVSCSFVTDVASLGDSPFVDGSAVNPCGQVI